MSNQRIVVLGLGQVGRVLCRQAQNVGVKIVAVADSSGAIRGDLVSGFTDDQLQHLVEGKGAGKRMSELQSDDPALQFVNVEDLVSDLASAEEGRDVVLADCSASDRTIERLLQASQHGLPIVLANKKPLSSSLAHFNQFRSQPKKFRHEATVGAGLPVIASLDRQIRAGDKVRKIEGAFSGTLGYIFSGLQDGEKFSKVVRTAKELGFTEPDPRDDLSGLDVARKALILARMLGGKMELEDIEIESLYPPTMADLSVDEFMAQLEELDVTIAEKVQNAQAKGCELRYAATVGDGGSSIKVGMIEADRSTNPLATLNGTDNMVAVHSEFYQSPLVVQGPGAGLEVTAAGVLSDIVDLVN